MVGVMWLKKSLSSAAAARLECLHRLFQRTATIAILDRTKMNPRISLSDLVARLESADHAIAYFNKPLPELLLDAAAFLRFAMNPEKCGGQSRGSLRCRATGLRYASASSRHRASP